MRKSEPKINSRSPWGKIDHIQILAPGIIFCGTPGHGGVWVSEENRKRLPDEFRDQEWFEEDCEFGIPETIFADEIEKFSGVNHRDAALCAWRNWLPDSYERHFGVTLLANESQAKARRMFDSDNRNNFVVQSASGPSSWEKWIPEGTVGVYARRSSDGVTRKFLVDPERYRSRKPMGYVIDETIDTAVQD